MRVLEVDSLSVEKKQNESVSHNILHEVSFSLSEGELFGLVGESGAGKTILASTLCGILPPSFKIKGGTISILGDKVYPDNKKLWEKKRGKDIFLMFQSASSALNPYMKVGKQIAEAIEIVKKLTYKSAVKLTISLLEKVGLSPEIIHSYPFQLSGGMQQRVLIAIALGLSPKILIADEPTTGLDPINQLNILNLLKKYREETLSSIIFISHDLNSISYLAEHVAILYKGSIVEKGNLKDILRNPKHEYTNELVKSIETLSIF